MHQETRRELERLRREHRLVEELEGDVSGMSEEVQRRKRRWWRHGGHRW